MNPLVIRLAQIQFSWAWRKYAAITKKRFDTATHAGILLKRAVSNFEYPIKHMILAELLITTIR